MLSPTAEEGNRSKMFSAGYLQFILTENTSVEYRQVLIVGGVSGSTAQQVLKHPAVEKLDIVELDGRVLAICNQFFPTIAAIFDHSKVSLLDDDAIEFLQKNENLYDVIIADTPEPMG